MKINIQSFAICSLLFALSAQSADAAAQVLVKTPTGYKVQYQYEDQPQLKEWFIGGKLGMNFAPVKIKQSVESVGLTDTISDTLRQFGGALFMGYRLADNWRLEGEAGYLTRGSNSEPGFDFSLSTPYAHIGATYNTDEKDWGWFYIGAAVGAAMPMTEYKSDYTLVDARTKTSFSPLGAIMLGYRAHVSNTWFVDLGYKFSAYQGHSHTQHFVNNALGGIIDSTSNKIDMVMNHTITLGLAWEF